MAAFEEIDALVKGFKAFQGLTSVPIELLGRAIEAMKEVERVEVERLRAKRVGDRRRMEACDEELRVLSVRLRELQEEFLPHIV